MVRWRVPTGLATFGALGAGLLLAGEGGRGAALALGAGGLALAGAAQWPPARALRGLLALTAVALLGGAAGALRGAPPEEPSAPELGREAQVSGRVAAWEAGERGISVRLEVHRIDGERCEPPLQVRCLGDASWGAIPAGAWLRVRGDLVPDRAGTNPGAWSPAEPGARLLPRRGARPEWAPGSAGILRLRESTAESLRSMLPGFSGRFASAVLLGRGGALLPEERAVFRRTGASHLVSVSGLHVGLVVMLVTMALSGAGRGPRALAAAAAAWGYAGLAGWAPSAVRASAMLTLWSMGRIARRPRRGIGWLCLALPWIIWCEPGFLFSVSFRLSAGAVAGLLFAAEVIPSGKGRGKSVRAAVVTSLGAQWGTLPTALQTFGTLSPLATFPNLIAIPLTGLFLPAVLLALAASGVPLVGDMFTAGAAVLGAAIWRTLNFAARAIPFASALSAPPLWVLAGAPLLMAVWFSAPPAKRRAQRWRVAALAFAVACVALSLWPQGPAAGPWAAFLDVGQGDAAVLRLSDGTIWVVDVGDDRGPGDAASNAILPFLRHARVRRVDGLVISHRHRDHVGALGPFLAGVPVARVYDAAYGNGSVAAGVDSLFNSRGLWPCIAAAGDTLHEGGAARLVAIHPRRGDPREPPPGNNLNEASLMVRVEDGDWSAILAGDGEHLSERACLEDGRPLAARVLKVGHHGSRTSTSEEFLRAVTPEWAVISCGVGNSYGHPDTATVARLERSGATVLRTDRDGAVIFRRRHGRWEVTTHPPR